MHDLLQTQLLALGALFGKAVLVLVQHREVTNLIELLPITNHFPLFASHVQDRFFKRVVAVHDLLRRSGFGVIHLRRRRSEKERKESHGERGQKTLVQDETIHVFRQMVVNRTPQGTTSVAGVRRVKIRKSDTGKSRSTFARAFGALNRAF